MLSLRFILTLNPMTMNCRGILESSLLSTWTSRLQVPGFSKLVLLLVPGSVTAGQGPTYVLGTMLLRAKGLHIRRADRCPGPSCLSLAAAVSACCACLREAVITTLEAASRAAWTNSALYAFSGAPAAASQLLAPPEQQAELCLCPPAASGAAWMSRPSLPILKTESAACVSRAALAALGLDCSAVWPVRPTCLNHCVSMPLTL